MNKNKKRAVAGIIGAVISIFLLINCPTTASAADLSGEALLITYPDYPVDTDTFYGYTSQVGHAGVLLIKESGLTKYYEFGRYDGVMNGLVKNRTIPDVDIANGRATPGSLKQVLSALSMIAGKGGRVRAAYFINMDFDQMNSYAVQRIESRASPYSATEFNCGHFAESVILRGHPGIDRPTILNPVPNNIVDEYIEEGNAEVTFAPETDELYIGEGDESDAKN